MSTFEPPNRTSPAGPGDGAELAVLEAQGDLRPPDCNLLQGPLGEILDRAKHELELADAARPYFERPYRDRDSKVRG